jgi:hypothetical protein
MLLTAGLSQHLEDNGGIMNLAFIDSFRNLMLSVTPWQAMMLGALVGLLPVVLTIVIGQLRWRRQPVEEMPAPAMALPVERMLTCVICKEVVKMSTFTQHIAVHQAQRTL